MNDPIKDFVEQHREEFDHLEAPLLNLNKLKAGFQRQPEEPKKTVRLFTINKFMAAASVLLAITCAWLFFKSYDSEKPAMQIAVQEKNPIANPVTSKEIPVVEIATKQNLPTPEQSRMQQQTHVPQKLYAGLQDSTSASSRLLAILEMEKTGRVDDAAMDRLAATLNNDGNTNVRLAALSLMEKYRDDSHVSSLLVNSLNKQSDPMVQLGLVSLLGKMKNIKIDDQLHALAGNPDTFAAVRDEAYNILLNQNKL